jgi:hypothetical protein
MTRFGPRAKSAGSGARGGARAAAAPAVAGNRPASSVPAAPGCEYACSAPRSLLAGIWGFADEHVPAVHARPWRDLVPNDFEAAMLTCAHPVQSHEFIALPARWRALAPVARLAVAARAAMEVIERARPRYHRSLLGERIVEASGTTLLLTARAPGHGIIGVPWSFDEPFGAALRRMVERKRRGMPALRPAQIALLHGYLPAVQAVVSVVSQERPYASLLGSGGSAPTGVCCGQREVGFTSEHRLFTPDDGKDFSDEFMARVEAALAGEGEKR